MSIYIKDKPMPGSIGKTTFMQDKMIPATKMEIEELKQRNFEKFKATQDGASSVADSIQPDSNGDYYV